MKETILIIEDEKDILVLLSSMLKSEGYSIITASNGREGLEKFQEFNPDLILTDVRMPVMDGIEVLREVKTKGSDTEVIILTGHSDEATAIDCLRLGAYDYFCKPLEDIDVLLTAVVRVLEKRSLELKNRSLVKQLEELSIKDPLTGLYNYRYLQTCLDEEIERSRRYGHKFFILMIDADHFKDINDTYGHLFGDHVLKKIGELILRELRSTDRLFRYGGEEFLVIMNELSKTEVVNVVSRQMASIRNHTFIHEGQKAKVTVSMGGAFFPEDAENKVNLIKTADQALYRAKDAGRDRFDCCFDLPVDVSDPNMEKMKYAHADLFAKPGGLN
ncbi:MAG: diguanylate cyclase [Deltaproteobacteria bacterium]|jgi:diguanylate cyclase (GGDEF)-like protein|nr:diguanylate cyclase [Deltaproteobacteria bacterium]